MNDNTTGRPESATSPVGSSLAGEQAGAAGQDGYYSPGTHGQADVPAVAGQYAVEVYGQYDESQYPEAQYPPQYPVASSLGPQPFEIVLRGYHRRQVDRYVADAHAVAQDLEARLMQYSHEVEWLRAEFAQAQEELVAAREAAVPRSPHAELSERMQRILALAQEEAAQERSAAEADAERERTEAQAEAEKIISDAVVKADAVLARAQAEAEVIVSTTRESAEREIAGCREQSEQLLNSSRQESERIMVSAWEQAEAVKRDLEYREARLQELESQRVGVLLATHEEATRRLEHLRDSLAEVLSGDQAAGPLDAYLRGDRPLPARLSEAGAVPEAAVSDAAQGARVEVEAEAVEAPDVEVPDVVAVQVVPVEVPEVVAEPVEVPEVVAEAVAVPEVVAEAVAVEVVEPAETVAQTGVDSSGEVWEPATETIEPVSTAVQPAVEVTEVTDSVEVTEVTDLPEVTEVVDVTDPSEVTEAPTVIDLTALEDPSTEAVVDVTEVLEPAEDQDDAQDADVPPAEDSDSSAHGPTSARVPRRPTPARTPPSKTGGGPSSQGTARTRTH